MTKRYLYGWAIALAVLVVSVSWLERAEAGKYNLRDRGIAPGDTIDGEHLASLIKELSDEAELTDIRLEAGTYYLTSGRSAYRRLYISNHDQTPEGLRPVGILLEGVRGLRLGGQGVRLVCLDDMLPIAVVGCEAVELRGLVIDYAEPTIAQSRIVENRGQEGIVFAPEAWVRSRINSDGAWEAYGDNWRSTMGAGIAFDPETRHILYRVSDLGYNTRGATLLGEGAVLAPNWRDERLPVGTIIAMRSHRRPYPAILIDGSRDSHLEDVVVHYASGMGLLAQNSHNVRLRRLDVRPSEGRYHATQADATHFSGCSGLIDVEGGRYEAMMDDAINVHGVYLRLTEQRDERTLVGRYMHAQAWGFAWGRKGDTVQLVRSSTFDVLPERLTIASIEPVEGELSLGVRSFVIRFAEPLPAGLSAGEGYGIENLSKEPAVRFVGNHILNNRARGALINTSRPVLIEGNHFAYVSGSAILVSSDCNEWYESGRTGEMTIRSNVFEDVLTSLYQFTEAVISICPIIPELGAQQSPFYGTSGRGIVIEGNTFKTFDTPLLFARSSASIRWRGNTITPTTSYPRFHPRQEAFSLEGSEPIIFER